MIPVFNLFLVLFIGLAAGFDLWERRIPNWLVLLAMIGGILLNVCKGMPQLAGSVCGLVLGVGIFMIPFALGWLGAGDVKLLGAVGAVLGVQQLPRVIFYSAILGGVFSLIVIALRRMRPQALQGTWRDMQLLILSQGAVLPETISARSRKGAGTIPYGVAIGCGTLVAFYVDPRGDWAGF